MSGDARNVDVMVLDDDVDLLTSVAELLADVGYKVKGFADPESAVEFAVDQKFAARVRVNLDPLRLASVSAFADRRRSGRGRGQLLAGTRSEGEHLGRT